MSKTVIISPSGSYYGSEQTLHCYLLNCKKDYDVYINNQPRTFLDKNIPNHKIFTFSNTKLLYLKLFFKILFKKYKIVYVNEGGHIKYIRFLALFFKRIKFFVHIRLVEDAKRERINNLTKNTKLFCVSDFIQNNLKLLTDVDIELLPSPMRESTLICDNVQLFDTTKPINVAVIGRVTPSKGCVEALHFIKYVNNLDSEKYVFHFYGNLEDNYSDVQKLIQFSKTSNVHVNFQGFQANKDKIYKSSDIVIHFNPIEPLGVIVFESLSYGVPFFGFANGGIGFIGNQLNLETLIDINETNWAELFDKKINDFNPLGYEKSRKLMLNKFSIENYCSTLERQIHA